MSWVAAADRGGAGAADDETVFVASSWLYWAMAALTAPTVMVAISSAVNILLVDQLMAAMAWADDFSSVWPAASRPGTWAS
jgi:hypothetical protein